jgi:hypothetical protein
MSTRLRYALFFASAIAGADARSELPSVSFDHTDWEIACDNTRTCRAAGYSPENSSPNATIMLTRVAGPDQPVTAQLQLSSDDDYPPDSKLAMSIDERTLGTVTIDRTTGTGNLSGVQTTALLPALLKDRRIAWKAAKSTWTISTAGANAVFLKMDEFQGRLDTPGALVRKGAKSEINVPPPITPPAVKAASVVQDDKPIALTTAQARELMTALRNTVKDDSCELLDANVDQNKLVARRLTGDKLLVSHACWAAFYNAGDGYWVVDAKPPYSAVLVTTLGTGYNDGEISSTLKGRGFGDCLGTATWTWDGTTFTHTSQATTGMCRHIRPDGAWNLPTLVTRVHPLR